MGTHPIFESDFDCLTDMNRPEQQNVWHDMVKSMQVAKKYTETAMINSVTFSMDGENFVTASDDDTLSVYSNDDGKLKRLLYSKKYGCQNVKFTHHPTQTELERTLHAGRAARHVRIGGRIHSRMERTEWGARLQAERSPPERCVFNGVQQFLRHSGDNLYTSLHLAARPKIRSARIAPVFRPCSAQL